MNRARRGLLAAAGIASVIAGAMGSSPGAVAASPGYNVVNVGAYGGEPSIVSDSLGQLFDTTPSGGTITYTSTNHGATWRQVTTADPRSGDDCLATDQANAVYLCNLAGSEGVAPLQADVWKSVDHGMTWTHGAVYAVPRDGFWREWGNEWLRSTEVTPVLRVLVRPSDFPLREVVAKG